LIAVVAYVPRHTLLMFPMSCDMGFLCPEPAHCRARFDHGPTCGSAGSDAFWNFRLVLARANPAHAMIHSPSPAAAEEQRLRPRKQAAIAGTDAEYDFQLLIEMMRR
ncbi:hypothetical protein, partial [Nonomuraea angiospora]